MKTIRTNLLNPISPSESKFYADYIISFDDKQIIKIEPFDSKVHLDYESKLDCLCIPGLIDLHVHLSQYYIRGQYRPALLPWLREVVFPEEHKSRQNDYALSLTHAFFKALLGGGTTTSVIYTAPYREACETAFFVADQLGVRAIIGMTLMDMNTPPELIQTTDYAISQSFALYEKWHAKSPLLDYIFTPRFAPTCSRELMTALGKFASEHQARIQSHLSENRAEIEWVKEIFGLSSYTEVYHKFGLLGENTIMAHCIHLNDNEMDLLAKTKTKIAHCPDSNFYLKSGEFPLKSIQEHQIQYGLGSDVGAGTSLNMFYHAKLYNYRQKTYPVLPEDAFYHITLGAAKVLNLEAQIGSIEVGKQADMVFISMKDRDLAEPETILSKLVFYGYEFPVESVFTSGKRCSLP